MTKLAVRNAIGPEYPQRALLLKCLQMLGKPGADHDEIAAMAEGADLADLIRTARRHQVLPLVAEALLRVPSLPADTADELRAYRIQLSLRNLGLAAVQREILVAMQNAHVRLLPYKGLALAVSAYGDVRLRSFADLDFLVAKADYSKAVATLKNLGFVSNSEYGNDSDDKAFLGATTAHSFVRDGTYVDLQWGSTYLEVLSIPIDDQFWDRLHELDINGHITPALSNEVRLLFICAHGSRHLWDRLKWVTDVAAMVASHPDLDWQWVLHRADTVGARRVVNISLLMASSLLNAPVREDILSAAYEDTYAHRLADRAARRLLCAEWIPLGRFERIRYTLGSKERLRHRLGYLRVALFEPNPHDLAFVRLPNRHRYLYRLVRPIRAIVDAVRQRRSG